MKKLALSDEILMSIEKPARYIGGEYNSIIKDKENIDIRFCMCFPDVYEIGMSHLGIQILYDMFNRREDTWCERVYSPWPDLDAIMREQNIPLFALESQEPIKDFDFLGITLQYEMCYTNILQVLDLAHIPIRSEQRKKSDPIVIGGGPCAYNPEPIADFFDIFYIGEGETVYDILLDLYKEYKYSDMSRREFLIKASNIPGLYVPCLYDVCYNDDGTIADFGPKYSNVPEKILKQVVTDMSSAPYPEKPIVPYMKVTQDRVVLEIMRGCIRGCRFCQAGMIYRPTRPKDVNVLKSYAENMLSSSGQEEITFSSLSSSDYQNLPELTDCLIEKMNSEHINISLPSLRIDAFSLDVMSKIQDVKKNSLTFAPEAGTQRLRNVINKGLTKEDIMDGSLKAFMGGWNKVKLYFMMGLPTETYEDIEGIAELSEEISELYFANIPKEKREGRVMVTASASYFVPKPFTPFQWAPMIEPEEFVKRAYYVKDKFREAKNHKSLKFQYHEADITILEGLLARGDRKLCDVIYDVYMSGQIYDAWTEYFHKENWENALEKNGIDIGFYTYRERSTDEILPWDFIDIGVTKEFMKKEWERAQAEQVTPNCRQKCSACGAARFKGGVCFEAKNKVFQAGES
ncbi:MAG: TIGR03960 family B12-binding radical SAM protein [Coprococcus sp.]